MSLDVGATTVPVSAGPCDVDDGACDAIVVVVVVAGAGAGVGCGGAVVVVVAVAGAVVVVVVGTDVVVVSADPLRPGWALMKTTVTQSRPSASVTEPIPT